MKCRKYWNFIRLIINEIRWKWLRWTISCWWRMCMYNLLYPHGSISFREFRPWHISGIGIFSLLRGWHWRAENSSTIWPIHVVQEFLFQFREQGCTRVHFHNYEIKETSLFFTSLSALENNTQHHIHLKNFTIKYYFITYILLIE